MKKLIKAATELVEKKNCFVENELHFQRAKSAILKFRALPWSNGYFKLWILLYQTAKTQKQSYLSIDFRMRGAEKRARPTRAPGQPILAKYEIFLKHFPRKKFYQNWKKMRVHFLIADFVWELS